MIILLLWLLVL